MLTLFLETTGKSQPAPLGQNSGDMKIRKQKRL